MKLSILVPVYNVSSFLPLCLESIMNQSEKDFECILINDGSTDNSLDILKDFAKKDKRFIIIDQKNGGYGKALNAGLEKAKGKYIGIVEPDDFIHRDMYKIMLREKADVIKCGFMNFYGKTWETEPERIFHEIKSVVNKNGTVITAPITKKGIEIDPKVNQKVFLVDPTIWSAVVKRDLIKKHKIKFLETPGASYQDIGFQFKTFAAAKSMYLIEQPLYYYRRDNDSSSVKSNKKQNAVKKEYDELEKTVDKDYETILNVCRFRSYNWNLYRLGFRDAINFAKQAKKDYIRTKFDANYFVNDNEARAKELKFSTKHPAIFVIFRPVFKIKNRVLRFIAQAFNKKRKVV